jgi:hypothetical protein
VIDTHRHNSGETPRGAEKEKEEDGKRREREEKARPMEWSRKMVGFVQRKQRISEYKT